MQRKIVFVARGDTKYGVATKLLTLFGILPNYDVNPIYYAIGGGILLDRVRARPNMEIEVDPRAPLPFLADGLRKLLVYGRLLLQSKRTADRLAGYLKKIGADAVVFCENGLIFPVAAAARLAKTPCYWLMPNLVSQSYVFDANRRVYKMIFSGLKVIPIANSQSTLESLGRGACYARRIDLGIDISQIDDNEVGADLDLPRGCVVLLVMARLIESKGQLLLLQALLALEGFDHVHLVVCGGPMGTDYVSAIEQEAERSGARDRLHLMGPVSNPAAYYRLADVVVNARIDPEPFGLSIVEAMVMGKPILAHANGGPAEIVIDGETGWLVSQPTLDDWKHGLQRMMTDQHRWTDMGHQARQRALTCYSGDSMTKQLLQITGLS